MTIMCKPALVDKASVGISDTISRNVIYTFVNRLDTRSKNEKVGVLKQNAALVTQLFLSRKVLPLSLIHEPPDILDEAS